MIHSMEGLDLLLLLLITLCPGLPETLHQQFILLDHLPDIFKDVSFLILYPSPPSVQCGALRTSLEESLEIRPLDYAE